MCQSATVEPFFTCGVYNGVLGIVPFQLADQVGKEINVNEEHVNPSTGLAACQMGHFLGSLELFLLGYNNIFSLTPQLWTSNNQETQEGRFRLHLAGFV